MIILYALPISLWPKLGKENRYFYIRHPNNNDRWLKSNLSYIYSDIMNIMIYGRRDFFSFKFKHNLKEGYGKKFGQKDL